MILLNHLGNYVLILFLTLSNTVAPLRRHQHRERCVDSRMLNEVIVVPSKIDVQSQMVVTAYFLS